MDKKEVTRMQIDAIYDMLFIWRSMAEEVQEKLRESYWNIDEHPMTLEKAMECRHTFRKISSIGNNIYTMLNVLEEIVAPDPEEDSEDKKEEE